MNEINEIKERYERRKNIGESTLYSPLSPSVYMSSQEKERAIINWSKFKGIKSFTDHTLLEIGCGSGSNLLEFIKLGFQPHNLVGNELLEERLHKAKEILPESTRLLLGDASHLEADGQLFDVIYQSTVFTSILDDEFRKKLANNMWSLVKPGGGVLWYDFIYDNPNNKDVQGIKVTQIRELFPNSTIKTWRLTLAPPISRRITKLHPSLYHFFNLFPFLRTHVLCWIEKK